MEDFGKIEKIEELENFLNSLSQLAPGNATCVTIGDETFVIERHPDGFVVRSQRDPTDHPTMPETGMRKLVLSKFPTG